MSLVSVNNHYDSHYKVGKLDEDIFIEMAKEIYIKTGFANFNTYYHQLKKSKNEIVSILLKHYTYIDDNNTHGIQKSLEEMHEIKNEILKCITYIFIEHATNITYHNILNYFNIITFNDLIHYENGDMIISKLHLEWLDRIRKLEDYYRTVDKEKDEYLVENKKHKKGMIGWVKYAFTYSKPTTTTYKYLEYMTTVNEEEHSSEEHYSEEEESIPLVDTTPKPIIYNTNYNKYELFTKGCNICIDIV
jgi:hypothetical protein